MSKKRKITFCVLAVILVFCFWYTRPRSFEDLSGAGEIRNYSMTASVSSTENGKAISETWTVNSYEDGTGTALKEILSSCKYRASLRSLLPFPSHDTIRGEGNTMIHFGVVMDSGSDFTAIYKGQTATISFDRTMVLKAEDQDISQKLLDFAKTYGSLTSSSVKE